MNNLIIGRTYNLKWATVKPNGSVHNLITLEGKFLKYFDNTLCEEFKNFKNSEDEQPRPPILATILDQNNNIIPKEFDDDLYPYIGFTTGKMSTSSDDNCNFGLFKILNEKTSIFKGVKQPHPRGPYNFVSLSTNTIINEDRTLMWVNLGKVQINPTIEELTTKMALRNVPIHNDLRNDIFKFIHSEDVYKMYIEEKKKESQKTKKAAEKIARFVSRKSKKGGRKTRNKKMNNWKKL